MNTDNYDNYNSMKIDHIAIWVTDLEKMRDFYLTYFDTESNALYCNPKDQFTSYFIRFKQGGCRIELMHRPDITALFEEQGSFLGLTHLAIALDGRDAVDALTRRFRTDGFTIAGEPRTSGDGYYESVILDPEGNRIELVAG